MAERYLNTPEFAAAVGVTAQTVRAWDRKNRLKPHHRSPGGMRWYTQRQVELYLSSQSSYRPSSSASAPGSPPVRTVYDEMLDSASATPTPAPEPVPAAPTDTVAFFKDDLTRLIRMAVQAVKLGATPEAFAETVWANPEIVTEASETA